MSAKKLFIFLVFFCAGAQAAVPTSVANDHLCTQSLMRQIFADQETVPAFNIHVVKRLMNRSRNQQIAIQSGASVPSGASEESVLLSQLEAISGQPSTTETLTLRQKALHAAVLAIEEKPQGLNRRMSDEKAAMLAQMIYLSVQGQEY